MSLPVLTGCPSRNNWQTKIKWNPPNSNLSRRGH